MDEVYRGAFMCLNIEELYFIEKNPLINFD
jgi:hypothetical protein